ncbi:SPOR domain-containing protein [bacterium]|nr:SPOR domain-containing protein [bacterium]MBU1959066.1 SPOR domain-containing protein [bacterium]
MKHFKFILLTLVSLHVVEAKTSNFIMPDTIQTQLCQQLSEKGCSTEEQLKVSNSFKLDNDRLLLFFYLYKPNDMYKHGYVNIPVIVDIQGKWSVINTHMDAEIQELGRDPQGGIWLRTLWMIEGASPALYYSKDGTKWTTVSFPLNRNVNSAFEDLSVCFLEKEIQLTFNSMGGDEIVKAWKTNYANAITKEPQWIRVPKKEICQRACFKTSAYNNAWQNKGTQQNLDLLFEHKYKPLKVSIPKYMAQKITVSKKSVVTTKTSSPINKTYAIQLGTFNYKSSLENMEKSMQKIEFTLHSKEFNTDKGIKYKLYLGSFKSRNLANNTLKELRNKDKNSKILKNAFVAELP